MAWGRWGGGCFYFSLTFLTFFLRCFLSLLPPPPPPHPPSFIAFFSSFFLLGLLLLLSSFFLFLFFWGWGVGRGLRVYMCNACFFYVFFTIHVLSSPTPPSIHPSLSTANSVFHAFCLLVDSVSTAVSRELVTSVFCVYHEKVVNFYFFIFFLGLGFIHWRSFCIHLNTSWIRNVHGCVGHTTFWVFTYVDREEVDGSTSKHAVCLTDCVCVCVCGFWWYLLIRVFGHAGEEGGAGVWALCRCLDKDNTTDINSAKPSIHTSH